MHKVTYISERNNIINNKNHGILIIAIHFSLVLKNNKKKIHM